MEHQIAARCGRALAACALILSLALVLDARPIIYTLVERTRKSSVIATIKVEALQSASITAVVIKVIKGDLAQSTIQVKWNRQQTTEFSPPVYSIGERVLIFGNVDGKMVEPLGEGSSNVSADKEDIGQYERAIGQIERFDHSREAGDANRRAILQEMLSPNAPISNEAALAIILRDTDLTAFPADEFIEPLVLLTKSTHRNIAVQSVQALGRIHSKAMMLPLIELLKSSDSNVSETAAMLIKQRTGLSFDFDAHASDQDRAAVAKKLAQWWEENKDKVDLHF